jgi:hypothetical protein
MVAMVLLLLAACGASTDPPKPHLRDIRVLKPIEIRGCDFRGVVSDEDMEDLLGKARKIYGDTVVLRDTTQGRLLLAEAYRCRVQ